MNLTRLLTKIASSYLENVPEMGESSASLPSRQLLSGTDPAEKEFRQELSIVPPCPF